MLLPSSILGKVERSHSDCRFTGLIPDWPIHHRKDLVRKSVSANERSPVVDGCRSSLTTMYSNDVNDVMPLDVCWCIKASRVDMSVRMLLQGIIVWQVYLWCRRSFRKEFVRSCDACQRTGKPRL